MDMFDSMRNVDTIFTRASCNDRLEAPTLSVSFQGEAGFTLTTTPRYEIHHVGIHGAECRTRRGAVVAMTIALLYHMVAEVLVVAGKPWKLWMSGEQCHTF